MGDTLNEIEERAKAHQSIVDSYGMRATSGPWLRGTVASSSRDVLALVGRVRELTDLASDLIAYSHLRDKVRLREDPSEYVEAERLIARFDALAASGEERE